LPKKAVVLLSGGLDSSTCLAIAQAQGFLCHALSFAYGQKHAVELRAAGRIAMQRGVMHQVMTLDIGQFGNSALTNRYVDVPDHQGGEKIPVTYVPARNTIFLAIALGYAEAIGSHDIFIGVSSVDYSYYPDCRPAFIEQFQILANVGTKAGIEGFPFTIHAPLQHFSKAASIQAGAQLGVDFGLTVSCYRANGAGEACGSCSSCVYRQRGFEEAGIEDPTVYQ
jgi:7-cyano-7-deazaguanine synthase